MVKNAAFAYIARRYNSAFEATSLLSSVASLAIPRMTMDISKAGISLGFRLLMRRSEPILNRFHHTPKFFSVYASTL